MVDAIGAGLGLAIVVMAITSSSPYGIAADLLVSLALGWAYRGRRWAAVAGLCLGAFGWAVAVSGLAADPPTENAGFGTFLILIVIFVYAVVTSFGLLIGGAIPSHPRPESLVGRALGATGALALVGLAVTYGVLLYAPARGSFEITVPPGWHVLSRWTVPWTENIEFGDDFTAVFGSNIAPSATDVPVIGVTAVWGNADSPEACYRAMDTWGRPESPLYDGAILETAEIELSVGQAHYEVRAGDSHGSAVRVHAFGLARARQVGILGERLCYIIAITVPPDGPITDKDALSIADSFRYR